MQEFPGEMMKTKALILAVLSVILATALLVCIVFSPIYSFGTPTEIRPLVDFSITDRTAVFGYAVFHYPQSNSGTTHAGQVIPKGRFILAYNTQWGFYMDYENSMGNILYSTNAGLLTFVKYGW